MKHDEQGNMDADRDRNSEPPPIFTYHPSVHPTHSERQEHTQ